MAQDDRRQRGLTLEELCTAPVFCWEQRTGRCFCGSAEFRILSGVQLNGSNLPFPGITPVGVSELHQGQVTPGCLPVVLHPSAGWEGDAAVGFQAVAPAQAALPQRHRFGRLEGPIFDCTVAIRVSLMLFLQAVKSWGCFSVIQFGRGSFR